MSTLAYVSELNAIVKMARAKETADRNSDTEESMRLRTAIFAAEKQLSPQAATWWFKRSSDALGAHLALFVRAFYWQHTRNGWRCFRWIKARQCYATKATLSGESVPQIEPYIRKA